MKYGQSWKIQVNQLPSFLAETCISYKQWKKRKNITYNDINQLIREIKRIDANFNHYWKLLYKPRSLLTLNINLTCCYNTITYGLSRYTKYDLLNYALINSTTLRKLCKRFDKREFPYSSMVWLNYERKYHAFCGGMMLKRLMLDVYGNENDTCPICLDDAPSKITIMTCGHIMCLECFYDMYKVREKHGTLPNIIKSQDYDKPSTCPICRIRYPYRDLQSTSFWNHQDKMQNKFNIYAQNHV